MVWWSKSLFVKLCSHSINNDPATQLSNGQFKLTGCCCTAEGTYSTTLHTMGTDHVKFVDSTGFWWLKHLLWTHSPSQHIPLTSNLLWSGWVRVLIGVEVGDGVCCGDPDDGDNYWGHSGGKTWGRAKEKTSNVGMCWRTYLMDGLLISDCVLTVGRESACRGITIWSTKTCEETENPYVNTVALKII